MIMIDYENAPHNHVVAKMVELVINKTQNNDPEFYRAMVAYYIFLVASTMGTTLATQDRDEVIINGYVLAFAPSGAGKGYATNIIEHMILKNFRKTFIEHTLPAVAETNLWRLATARAGSKGTSEDEEHLALEKEYLSTGAFPFTFDNASEPAVKQVRQKLLLAGCGALNLQIDEIGSNLLGSTDVLNTYLQLYDAGLIKPKLKMNTAENKRTQEIEGSTPANMLLFGTPSKLLDGGQTEDHFYEFLETGYARRSIFASGKPKALSDDLTPTEIFNRLTDPQINQDMDTLSTHFEQMADLSKLNWQIEVPRDVSIALIEYHSECKSKEKALPENENIQRTEMHHRHSKALKLAGAYAFIDEVSVMDMSHLASAIKLVEESGQSFQNLLSRETTYMKLARYIASVGKDITHADLFEALPFYKSSVSARNDQITMATAWGYKHNIMLKKTFTDGIEFFSGETLEETDLSSVDLSYSDDFAYHYQSEKVEFDKIHMLTQAPGHHWANHGFTNGHRCEENVQEGFNLIVLDVDGGVPLSLAQDLLSDYTFMTYTTKRHTADKNRFRIVIPINYKLKLDRTDYGKFMDNVVSWLPFEIDKDANQRSRKWMTNPAGQYHYNVTDQLLDVLPFVPKTSKNEQFTEITTKLHNLDNLERWFAQRIATGPRNNQMIKYALALVDSGMSYADVEQSVLSFNDKLSNKLSQEELRQTVLVTVAKKTNQ